MGLIAPTVAQRVGQQTAWLIVLGLVFGGAAQLAVRLTRSPAALATVWYRLGGGGIAAVGWTLASETMSLDAGVAGFIIVGSALAGDALDGFLLAIAAVGLIACIASVVRALDVRWPAKADRRGAGGAIRIFAAWAVILLMLVSAGIAGLLGGSLAATGTALVVAVLVCSYSTVSIASRLGEVATIRSSAP